MIRRSDVTVSDAAGTPEGGVYITVKDDTGTLATLYDDAGGLLANPFQSDAVTGVFTYNIADGDAGTFTEEFRLTPSGTPRTIEAIDLNVSSASLHYATLATLPDPNPAKMAYVTDKGFGTGIPAISNGYRWLNLNGIPLPVATGTFFDSTAGDLFTALDYPVDAKLTVTGPQAAFSSATAVALDMKVKRADASVIDWAFDTFAVDATYTVTSFPGADIPGVYTGSLNDVLLLCAGQLRSHPGSATSLFAWLTNGNADLISDPGGGFAFSPGAVVRSRYIKAGDAVSHVVTYPATADHTMALTQVMAATAYELPRMFSAPFVRFAQGILTMTSLKVSASYPNALFAFVGDSIVQGRFATAFADGFPQRVRASYPQQVLVAGAPSAQTSDWLTPIQDIVAMQPRFAFILLGTNDIGNGRSLASIEADYTSIANQLIAANITPIAITVPPRGSANVPTFNTWLKAQGWRYVDIYPLLLGTGTAMHPTYDNGDGIHPNTAGHAVIANAVMASIVAEGLTP